MRFSLEGLLRAMYLRPANRPLISGVCTSAPAIDYIANCSNTNALTVQALATGTLRAVPFWAPKRASSLDRLAAEVTTAVAGRFFRLGLYRNVADPASFYPGALLADSGDIESATTGIKAYAISQALEPDVLYWLTISTSNTVTIRALSYIACFATIGIPAGTSGTTAPFGLWIQATFTHGALPGTFPAGGTYGGVGSTVCPALRYRFGT